MISIRGRVNLPGLQGEWELISIKDNILTCIKDNKHIIHYYDVIVQEVVRRSRGKWQDPRTWYLHSPDVRHGYERADSAGLRYEPAYDMLSIDQRRQVEGKWWDEVKARLPIPTSDDANIIRWTQWALNLKDSAKSGDFVKGLKVDGYTTNFKIMKNLSRRGISILEGEEPRTFEQFLNSITKTQSE